MPKRHTAEQAMHSVSRKGIWNCSVALMMALALGLLD